jgi:hypothetical protein
LALMASASALGMRTAITTPINVVSVRLSGLWRA